jgi:hypothetical protein
MLAVWPTLDSTIESGALVVRGIVRPSAITEEYRIRLTYRDRGVPKIQVVSPKLARRPQEPDTPIPHTYQFLTVGSERPCVYYPRSREWTPAMPIAWTVMPWLLSWLVDYEVWFATGEWFGGGVPHGDVKSPNEPALGNEAA